MRKIGLVLGGGGARALAHIGVLKVLEDEDRRNDRTQGDHCDQGTQRVEL